MCCWRIGKFARENASQGVNLQIRPRRFMDRWLVAPVNNGFVRGTYELGPIAAVG